MNENMVWADSQDYGADEILSHPFTLTPPVQRAACALHLLLSPQESTFGYATQTSPSNIPDNRTDHSVIHFTHLSRRSRRNLTPSYHNSEYDTIPYFIYSAVSLPFHRRSWPYPFHLYSQKAPQHCISPSHSLSLLPSLTA